MSPVRARSVTIGTDRFKVRQGPQNFVRTSAAVMAPRTEISGQPGAESLARRFYSWTLTDFSGGEGRLVFDQSDPFGPPTYKQTDGGVDVSIRGEVKMSPVAIPAVEDDGASTTTRYEGNTLTNATGAETNQGSNKVLHAVNEGGYRQEAPGAVAVTVVARFVAIDPGTSLTVRLRIRNHTDTTDVTSTTQTFLGAGGKDQVGTLNQSFTGTAGKTYRYFAEISAGSGVAEIDYLEVTAGGAPPIDVRALGLGYGDNIFAYHWDGTNTDIFEWDFTNNIWISVDPDVDNSQPVAITNSDKYNYLLTADRVIFRHTDTVAASVTYTTAPASTTAGGIAVANNRLYQLLFGTSRQLGEITLDGAGAFSSGTADWKVVATTADFPDEETPDTTLRQRMTSTGNGVRFFVNARGGASHVYQFSDGALRPLANAVLGGGYTITAIHHYMGTTFLTAQYSSRGATPAKERSALYYIGADEVMRFAGDFRKHDPDDERPAFIQTDQNYVYVLQGKYLWKYNGALGGMVLDTQLGPTTDGNARSFAVMDTKKAVCYSGESVHISQDSYPIDQSVYLYSPVWDYDVPDTNKTLLRVDIVTKPLPANASISLDYQDNEDDTWTTVTAPASASTTGSANHTFVLWGTAASPATVNFRNLQWRVGLRSSDGEDTPTVRSVTARASVIDYEESFNMLLDISNDTSSNHLAGQQPSGRQKANNLLAYKTAKALVPFEDHYSSERPGDKDSYAAMLTDVVLDLDDKGEGTARVNLVTIA